MAKGTEHLTEHPNMAPEQSPLQQGPWSPWSCIGQGVANAFSVTDAMPTIDPITKERARNIAPMVRLSII